MRKGMYLPALGLSFLLGIETLLALPSLVSAYWLSALVPLMCAAWRWRAWRYALVFALGFAWAWWAAYATLAHRLPATLNKVDINVTGVVQPFPKVGPHITTFTLAVTQADLGDHASTKGQTHFPNTIRLSWYWPHKTLRAGETWRFQVRLKQPNGFQNPGGFDYEKWLFQNAIGATGYVRHDNGVRVAKSDAYGVLALRQRLGQMIDHDVIDARYRGILKGVTMGDGHAISPAQWRVFRRTGIMHLVVISGSHIVLVAGFIGFLVSFLWRRSVFLCERLAARRAAVIAGFLAAVVYALVAGFGIPVQRAIIMFAIGGVALWRAQTVRPFSILALALVGVLVYDPFAPLAPGFWLSFGAVAVLIYVFSGRSRRGWLQTIIWAQLAVSLALVPFLALFFGQASLISPLANWIAIPVFELLVVPVALLGVVVGMVWLAAGGVVLNFASWLLSLLWPLMVTLSQWPGALTHFATPSLGVALLAVVGVVWLVAPRGVPARIWGLVLFVPLVFAPQSRPPQGGFNLTLLDVGQGLSAVVRTHRHSLVFDTGPAFGSGNDTGAMVVVPYLASQGIEHPDLLIISHGDNDHAGGAQSLLSAFAPLPIMTSARKQFPRASACVQGVRWQWDGVKFEILNPAQANGSGSDNNRSCVLAITAQGGRALLTGDIEASAERRLLHAEAAMLPSAVIVAPHHGSATSSSAAFVRAVKPIFALFPVGYLNQWHFPRKPVKARYRAAGAHLLDTSACGAIRLRVDTQVRFQWAWRAAQQHLWTRQAKTRCH